MSRLFTLKKWLSLSDAAKRLSTSFDEEVTEADVIQLALDGHLRLSLRLLASHVYALRWYKRLESEIEYEEVEYRLQERDSTGKSTFTRMEPVGGEVAYLPEFCGEKERLQLGTFAIAYARDFPGRDIVDLPVTSYSRVFLLQCLDELSRPSEPAQYDTGRLLIQEENGDLWQIESYDDCLLEDIEIVLRTKVLRELEQSFEPKPEVNQERPFSTRERETLLTLVATMAKEGYKHDPSNKAKSAVSEILQDVQKNGLSISDQTIRDKLKEAWALLPGAPRKA